MIIITEDIILDAEIRLPLSKSLSNRALMIAFYGGFDLDIKKLSDSDDTLLLHNLLNKVISAKTTDTITLDCHNAGTVLRFLMTALAMTSGTWILTGCERMKHRPHTALVDVLKSLGADIEYVESDLQIPLKIKGHDIKGGVAQIKPEQSSQFVSSLLMAAPLWKEGLVLNINGEFSSLPYIDMTISMMADAGIDVKRNTNYIVVKPEKYNDFFENIEPDWSAAAFLYEIVALSDSSSFLLKKLKYNSLQADSVAKNLFESFGVVSYENEKGIKIENKFTPTKYFTHDFTNCPDLFPAVVASCAGLQINASFTGLKNLSIKESDRKKAMMNELSKINCRFKETSEDSLEMFCPMTLPHFSEDNPIIFNNYNDHRIAMALAILSLKIGAISMENIDVVNKSYPDFFKLPLFKKNI